MGNCVGSKGGKKDPKKLTDEEIKLLMDNTRLTRPQILALHRNFLKECPSGKLTKKDFVKLFKEVHPSETKKEKADKFCEYVFKVIDKQKLGYISFQEFVLCFILTSDGDFKDKCEFAFQLYDLDKDGKISKKEMTQVLTALYDLSGITDRKGNNAPAKKVDDIIRKINAEHKPVDAPAAVVEPAKPAKPGKEVKPGKAAKPVKVTTKPVKGPEYITKDQFIAACNADEQIKQLFVDSIFCGGSDAGLSFTEPAHGATATTSGFGLTAEAPAVTVTSRSLVTVDGNTVVDTAHDPDVLKFEMPSVNANFEAPAVEVRADAPIVEVNAEAPTVSVSAEAPAVNVNVDEPNAEVNVTAPTVEVKEGEPAVPVAAN
jgi:Ca2+-binding EF-hand superfamily protein